LTETPNLWPFETQHAQALMYSILKEERKPMREWRTEIPSLEIDFSSWYSISPKWNGNLNGGYAKTYNFSRDYEAFYSWWDIRFGWKTSTTLELGATYDMYLEGNPAGHIEDITYNARPCISLTPVNDLNVRIYIDNVFVRSTNRLEVIAPPNECASCLRVSCATGL
jgi:hypothetical protein